MAAGWRTFDARRPFEDGGRRRHATPDQIASTIADCLPVGAFAMHGQRWSYVNTRLVEITGLGEEALLGGQLWDHIHPDDRARLDAQRAAWGGLTPGGPPTAAEDVYRLEHPDGRPRLIRLRAARADDTGAFGLVGTVEDITPPIPAVRHPDLRTDAATGPTLDDAGHALAQAIELGQLRLRYQPIVELASGRVVAAEALVRWRHPQLGLLAPPDFLAMAEATGTIGSLGSWVLAEAIRQAAAWAADATMPVGLAVHVNLSSTQLLAGELAERTAAMLAALEVPAAMLCVEMTERALGDGDGLVQGELAAFRQQGVRVAIDHFGTGSTSLAHLQRHPVDVVKLDGGVVAGSSVGEADTAIAATILSLAAALGIEPIAEGIERADQRSALLDLGCRYGQGFLFSEALPADELADHARIAAAAAERSDGPTPRPSLRPSTPPGATHPHVDGRWNLAEDALSSGQHPLP